jgi:hypothetical protein
MYGTAQNYVILHKVVQYLSQHNLIISKYCHIQKAPSNKIMIQIKLLSMSMIFQCTKLHLTKYSGS